MDNAKRAALAQKAVELMDEGGKMGVVDLLADLRHLCDRDGLDFSELDRVGYMHYLEEKS